jgi:hypothetical protein
MKYITSRWMTMIFRLQKNLHTGAVINGVFNNAVGITQQHDRISVNDDLDRIWKVVVT